MGRTVESDPAGTARPDAVSPPPSPRPSLLAAVVRPPYRNAIVVIGIAVTMASIFAVSYTVALARPTPHDIPAGVVGDPAGRPGVLAALEGAMFQLRANAGSLSLRAWLICIVVLALVGGLVLTLITDGLLSALRGPFPELWAALTAEVAAAALFASAMLTLIGRWAIVPTWGLLVAIGNAASGGAVAPPLLPSFYRFVGQFLPNGATVETIRNAVYFTEYQHLEPILVEAAWIVGVLVLLMVAARRRGRTPGTG